MITFLLLPGFGALCFAAGYWLGLQWRGGNLGRNRLIWNEGRTIRGRRHSGGYQPRPSTGQRQIVMVDRDGLPVTSEMASRLDAARQALRQEQHRLEVLRDGTWRADWVSPNEDGSFSVGLSRDPNPPPKEP